MRLVNGSMPQAPWAFSGANFALSSIATMLFYRCDDPFLVDSETRGVFFLSVIAHWMVALPARRLCRE